MHISQLEYKMHCTGVHIQVSKGIDTVVTGRNLAPSGLTLKNAGGQLVDQVKW